MLSWLVSGVLAATPMTLDDVVRTAIASNPALQRSVVDVDAAEGRLLTAHGVFDPKFGAELGWTPRDVSKFSFQGFPTEKRGTAWSLGTSLGGATRYGSSYGVSLGLNHQFARYLTDFGLGETETTQDDYYGNLGVWFAQPLLEGFGSDYSMRWVRSATSARDQMSLAQESQRQTAIAAASRAYWTWAYVDAARQIGADAEAASGEALRVGRLREAAGTIAPVELVRLEAGHVQAKTQRVEAEHAVVRARHAVELVIGAPIPEDAVPATAPGEVSPSFDVTAAVTRSLAQNPDLLVLRLARDEVEARLGDAKSLLRPSLLATASTGVGTQSTSAGDALAGLATAGAFPTVSLGADLEVPLGNRSARGEVHVATAELHGIELRVHELETALAIQVEDAALAIASAAQRVELADSNVRLQRVLLDAEEGKIAIGGAIEQDLLTVRSAHSAARAEAFRARTDLRAAEVELLRLQGALTSP